MNDGISLASLMRITMNARKLQYSLNTEPDSRLVSENVLIPLLKTLGWEFEETGKISSLKWGKPYFSYNPNKNMYAGFIGGEPQLVVVSHAGEMTGATLTALLQYAYNKDTSWAMSVSPKLLRLFHTHENVLKSNENVNPYWELQLETLPDQQNVVKRILSAYEVSQGTLCNLDKDVRQNKRVALPLNHKLFESLKHWRSAIIDRIYKNSTKQAILTELDRKVNHLLNQIVFIRVAEDRQFGEIPYLIEILNRWIISDRQSGKLLTELQLLFEGYAKRYQVDLFTNGSILQEHSIEELIAELIRSLHSPGFPTVKYDFSVIDVDILGTMYEQYLRLKPRELPEDKEKQTRLLGDAPTIELIPSDRAVGIHYTPTYIVNYIVASTMRRWTSQKGDSGSPKVLDMACGSGSFLLSAYRWLLRDEENRRGKRLEKSERHKLLTDLIWGVDKDPNAVEICKLNLWLYALESRQSLPNLDQNIKIGDSLIDASLSGSTQSLLFNDQPLLPPIIWNRDFQSVMQNGGWDVIVGNPPYIRIQKLSDREKQTYTKQFDLLRSNFDLSLAFVDMSLKLLGNGGVSGHIIINSFLRANYASFLRKHLVSKHALLGIVDFTDQRVFEGIGAYTCILFMGNPGTTQPRMGVVLQLSPCPAAQLARWELEDVYDNTLVSGQIDTSRLTEKPWVLVPDNEYNLRDKLDSIGTPLRKLVRIFQGFKTGMDSAFILQSKIQLKTDGLIEMLATNGRKYNIESQICLPLVKSGDIHRFHIRKPNHWVIFPYENGKALPEVEICYRYPQAWSYLNEAKERLSTRKEVQMGRVRWYAYSFPKSMNLYSQPKILTPDIAPQASFGLNKEGHLAFTGGVAGGYGLSLIGNDISYEYLLGLLNCRVFDWYVQAIAAQFHGGYYSYEKRFIENAPIVIPNNPKDIENIVSVVQLIQHEYNKSASGEIKNEREYRNISNNLLQLETELNDEVMKLYDLKDSEKRLIRESPYWRKANVI